MKPLAHTGDSSNIAFYAEPPRTPDRVFCEVLRQDLHRPKGSKKLVVMDRPRFSIVVYREGQGRIATRKYRPRKPVEPGRLPDAVVTVLVRKALKAAAA